MRVRLLLALGCSVMITMGVGCKKAGKGEVRDIPDEEIERLVPEILVQAKVLSTSEPEPNRVEAVLGIAHVYRGEATLAHQGFVVRFNKSGQGMVGMAIYPPLEKGEVGIWSLYKKDNGLLVYPWGLADMEIALPARKGISETYEDVRALAEAMEAVVAADRDKRLGLLKTYSRSQMPKVSMWAVRVLEELRNGQAKE